MCTRWNLHRVVSRFRGPLQAWSCNWGHLPLEACSRTEAGLGLLHLDLKRSFKTAWSLCAIIGCRNYSFFIKNIYIYIIIRLVSFLKLRIKISMILCFAKSSFFACIPSVIFDKSMYLSHQYNLLLRFLVFLFTFLNTVSNLNALKLIFQVFINLSQLKELLLKAITRFDH